MCLKKIEYTESHINNSIHIETFGEGDPLLIINGVPGMNSEGFKPLALRLAEKNKVILYDQRGTGKSTLDKINKYTITLDLMVQDIETIRDSLNIKEWVVLGHSFGGMLGAYYTSKYPHNVKGLILSSSGGLDMELFKTLNLTKHLTKKEIDSLNYYARKIEKGDASYGTKLKRGKLLAPVYVYDNSHANIVAQRLTQINLKINQLVLQNMRKIDFDCKEELKDFNKPVLIIQGKQDIIPNEIAEKANSVLPNSKVTILDKCGHYGWLDQPEKYFSEIDEYLKRLI